jgi:hypothetical protein
LDIDENEECEESLELDQNTIIRKIVKGYENEISVYKKNSNQLICKDILKYDELLGIKSLGDKNIIVLAKRGLYIYHFNESNKFISLNYYYKMDYLENNVYYINLYVYNCNVAKRLKNYKKVFSKPILPLSNYKSFYNDKWVSFVKDNKLSFLKYGAELLTFAIKEHNLELIEEVYKKSMKYFKEDLRNNRMFLSIITSTMSLLNEYYPEYIIRYSSETTMIIDSPSYNINHKNSNLHLCSFFQYPKINRLILVFWGRKYEKLTILILLFFSPILLIIFLGRVVWNKFLKHNFINIFYKLFEHTYTPTITFMNPYIKFVNYPQDYNWFLELIKPQPSPFVKTINRDIYNTWSGETLINFKWETYGKYYYGIIWIVFMALLGCFTAAATIPQQYIDVDIRNQLLIVSIILGFIHLSFEIRQFIYDPIKWIYNFWNIFGNIF